MPPPRRTSDVGLSSAVFFEPHQPKAILGQPPRVICIRNAGDVHDTTVGGTVGYDRSGGGLLRLNSLIQGHEVRGPRTQESHKVALWNPEPLSGIGTLSGKGAWRGEGYPRARSSVCYGIRVRSRSHLDTGFPGATV